MLRDGTSGAFTSRGYFPRWVCLRFTLLTWCLTVTVFMIMKLFKLYFGQHESSAAFVEAQCQNQHFDLSVVSSVVEEGMGGGGRGRR